MLKKHLTNLILETIGEVDVPYFMPEDPIEQGRIQGRNMTIVYLREKVPELVEKINNKIINEITDIYINADQREDRVELSDIEKLLQ